MAEEFQESEVIFEENFAGEECGEVGDFQSRNGRRRKKEAAVPVNIPAENASRKSWLHRYMDPDLDGGDDGEMVPPHVIIGRRLAGKMTSFSVCTGNGRTLKGRDLSEVRNSILRMTGFLET